MSDPPASDLTRGSQGARWQPPPWAPLVLFLLFGAGMLTWNPDAWIHPLVDYGRELYVPWRITEGAVLYRDIAYFNGPLSPYVNATWFTLFGVNMHVLTAANVGVIAGVLALTYWLLARIGDRFSATVAGVLFLLLFGFQHTDYLGNFSWVAPYSHEMTHGIGLTVLAVWLLSRFMERAGRLLLAGVGLTLGAVFLTKPEVFAAAVLAVGAGLALRAASKGEGVAALSRQVALVAATGLVMPALALLALSMAMPFQDALMGTLGGWVHVTNEELTALPFYSDGRGTKDTAASLVAMARWTGWFLAALVPSLLASYLARRADASQQRGCELAMVVVMVLLVWASNWCLLDAPGLAGYWFPGELSFSPILVFLLVLTTLFAARFWRQPDERTVLTLTLCALALGLLPKILLNVRFHQYGFGLAFPATLLSVVGLLRWLPRWLDRLGWAGGVFRGGALGLLLALLIGCMKIVGLWFSEKTAVQGGEHESFHCRESAYTQPTRFVMPWLLENTSPTDTLLVLPEGISMNYFTRRVNPTRQINFMPPEVIMYSEDRVLSDLMANPADYVVLVHRVTGEYGPDYAMFGAHYGRKIMQWVARNYEGIKLFGARPLHIDRLKDGRWGALVMKRMKR